MNIGVISLVILGALALVIFLFWQNQKDKKQLTDQLNNDYRKSKDEEGDTDPEDPRV